MVKNFELIFHFSNFRRYVNFDFNDVVESVISLDATNFFFKLGNYVGNSGTFDLTKVYTRYFQKISIVVPINNA